MEYGLQLFSVRDVTERDMEGALRQVAEMGYRSVEFAAWLQKRMNSGMKRLVLVIGGPYGFSERLRVLRTSGSTVKRKRQ